MPKLSASLLPALSPLYRCNSAAAMGLMMQNRNKKVNA